MKVHSEMLISFTRTGLVIVNALHQDDETLPKENTLTLSFAKLTASTSFVEQMATAGTR